MGKKVIYFNKFTSKTDIPSIVFTMFSQVLGNLWLKEIPEFPTCNYNFEMVFNFYYDLL